jgi:hypothetical protein
MSYGASQHRIAPRSMSAHIKIYVIGLKRLQSLLQTVRNIGMMRVPDFTGDENLGPGHTAILDPFSDLALVLVDQSAIEMAVSILESVGHS